MFAGRQSGSGGNVDPPATRSRSDYRMAGDRPAAIRGGSVAPLRSCPWPSNEPAARFWSPT
jgi:hypothetical protein